MSTADSPLSPNDILALFKKRGLPSQFCIVPFTNLIFNPNGDVGVCRQKGTVHVVGNIKKDTIGEIWNGEYLQKWRREFLTGKIETCAKEIHNDSCHLMAENYSLFEAIELSPEQNQNFLKLTANFNGLCNLKCTMCDIWMMENGLYDKLGFWDRAETEFFPFIREIEMLSGEPFIQKDTYRLIETVSTLNEKVWWSFTTNSHWRLNQKIKTALDKIRIKNIICSVDSLDPELYPKIRRGGSLSTVLKNIEDLKEYERERVKKQRSPLNLTLHFLVMRNNWHELPAVVDFVEKRKMKLIVNNCYEPSDLSLHSLDNKMELDIAFEVFEKVSPEALKRIMPFFMGIAHDIEPVQKAELLLAIRKKLKSA